MKRFLIFISLLLFLAMINKIIYSQETDPYQIIDSLRTKLESIHDYQAEIEIEVDVEFIKMPVKHATIYFKQPDKIKFRSDEFIMIPKKGFNNQLLTILNEPYNAIYIDEEVIEDRANHVIKIIPLGKKPRIILATWWIDKEDFRLTKTENNTRDEGSFTVSFTYRNKEMVLPIEMAIAFEIENMRMPMKFIGKSSGSVGENIDNTSNKQTGLVFIRFSNYKINQQIEDKIFEEDEN
ncbi:MAG: hypothetical protein R2750_06030 [Bacteroidales bacterium]